VYPALVAGDGTAHGTLLTGLTRAEWNTLDAFEDTVYDLQKLVLDGGRTGWAYVCADDSETLPDAWDMEHFGRHEIEPYLDRCRQWRARYEQRGH
jgi:gamma-glutamylcyclotransferase (GGCT)/AIG2-like uncharacterized protein YtfP